MNNVHEMNYGVCRVYKIDFNENNLSGPVDMWSGSPIE